MSIAPLVEGAKFFRILNGRHEFENARGLQTLTNKILILQQKYAIGTKDSWDRWLHGIAAYYTDGMTAEQVIKHLSDAKESQRERIKRENAKVRRKRK